MTSSSKSDSSPSRASAADVRTVAKGGIVQFAGMGTNRAANVLFVAIAVRLLGPAGYGLYRQIAQLLYTVGTFATGGFDTAALRNIAQGRATRDAGLVRGAARLALGSVAIISSLVMIALLFAAGPIARAFADRPEQVAEMTFLIRLAAPFVPLFAIMQVLRACTQGYKTVIPSVIVGNVAQPVLLLVVSTAALVLGYGVAGAIGGLVASVVLALMVAIWFYRRLFTAEERAAKPVASLRSMTGFALPRAGERLFNLGGAGTILLGLFSIDLEVGLFAVAVSLQSISVIFLQAVLSIWQPMVADLQQRREMDRLGGLYQTINRWVASGSFGLVAALMILPEPFVRVLGGESVSEAAILTSILAAGTFIHVGSGPCAMLLTMSGYPVVNLLNNIVAMSLYVGLAWVSVPAHGALGMAIVHTGTLTALNVARIVEGRILTGIQPFGVSFLKPITATLVTGIVLLLWRLFLPRQLTLDIAGLAVAGALYAGALWLMGADAEDRIVYERVKARLKGLLPRKEIPRS